MNGVRVCDIGEDAPTGWVDPLVPLARERLPALEEHRWFDSLRNRLEETLHEAGHDRAIVELKEDLPRGGDITERVRAHLYLGDLEGALATWDEPGAEMGPLEDGVLQRGPLLCMAGRTAEAFEAFDAHLEAVNDEHTHWRRDALFRDGLCALGAGEVERAEGRAAELATMEYAQSETELLQARIAAERGELHEWTGRDLREPAALLVAEALAEAEAWDELLAFLERSPLDHRLGTPLVRATAGLYNAIFVPASNTGQLERLATALEAAASELQAETTRVVEGSGEAEAIAAPMQRVLQNQATSEAALRRAGELHRYLAVLHGRRWDPRAERELDEAERLLGSESVQPLREAFAFLHGEWDRDAEDPDIRNLSRIYLGLSPEPDFTLDRGDASHLGLALLHPSGWEVEHAIAALHREEPGGDAWPDGSSLPGARTWQKMRVQELEASLTVLFYRLTHVIVHGEAMGFDVTEHRAQLHALRELVNAHPDPHLLMGPSGSYEL